MWSVREVVLPCQRQDQMLGRPIRVTCRERYQAGEDPEERNPLDHDGTCLRHRQSRNSEVRSPYLNSRRSMKKDPDKICCASEAYLVWIFLHTPQDRKSTRLNSSHSQISYAVFCLKKKNNDKLRISFRVDRLSRRVGGHSH